MIKIDYTKQEIEKIILDEIEYVILNPDSTLEDNLQIDLGFDSLDTIELIMNLEQTLKISVNDNDVSDIQTGNEIIEYIQKNYTINEDGKE